MIALKVEGAARVLNQFEKIRRTFHRFTHRQDRRFMVTRQRAGEIALRRARERRARGEVEPPSRSTHRSRP